MSKTQHRTEKTSETKPARRSVAAVAVIGMLPATAARAQWGESWGEMLWGAPIGTPVPGLDGWGLLLLPAALAGAALWLFARRSHRRATLLLLVALALPVTAYAATIAVPHVFVNGTVADATEVNANFDTLVMESNDQDGRLAALEATDITAITAGTGLLGGGASGSVQLDVDTSTIQQRVTGTCPVGQAIRTIASNGSVTCEVDNDTTYAAGAGLQLLGTTFSVDPALDTNCGSAGTCTTVYGNDFQYPAGETRTVVVGPERMIHRAGGPRSMPSNGQWYVVNASTSATGTERYMDAPLTEIPNGATVEAMTCRLYDGSATYEVGINLYECSTNCTTRLDTDWCYTGAAGGCASNPSAVTFLNVMSPSITPFVFDSESFSYHLSYFTLGTGCSAACRYYYCEITYTVPGPQ